MRIGIDIRPLLQSQYSGVSEYTFRLLEAMFRHDSDSQYTLFYNAHKKYTSNIPNFNRSNVIVESSNWPNKLFNFSQAFFDYPKLDKFIKPQDLLFFPNYNFASVSPKTPHIFTVHDLSFERFPQFFDAKHRLWHSLIQTKRLSKEATHLIAVSQSTKWDLMNLYDIPEEKITVIHEGIFNIFFENVDTQSIELVKSKFKLPENFLLFVGTVEPRKNIISIIEALNFLPPEISLVIAGKKGWKSDSIYKAASKFQDRIKFLDYVSQDEKRALIKLAKVFVWPSYYEGFGLPLLEAQAGGLPIVTSSNSSLSEVIGDSGLYCDQDDVRNIAKNIEALLNDQRLYNMMAQRGALNAKNFTWDKAATQTLDLFRKLT